MLLNMLNAWQNSIFLISAANIPSSEASCLQASNFKDRVSAWDKHKSMLMSYNTQKTKAKDTEKKMLQDTCNYSKKIAAFWYSSYRTYKASSGCSYSQDQTVFLNFWSQAQALTKLFSTVELPWRFWCFSTNVTVDIAQFVTFANNCKCWSMYRIRLLAYSGLDVSRKWQVQINKCWQQVPMIDLVLLENITKRYKDTKRVSVITTTLSHEKISPNASSGFMACRTRWRKHSCNLSFR